MDHVGMDLGRRQSHASWLTADGEVVYRRILSTKEQLTKHFGGRTGRLLIEATAMSEWVARHVESLGGWEVVVADPNFAPMYAERTRRVKTDRRDAEALMWACKNGTYRRAHRLSDEARQLRATVKVRKNLVRMRGKMLVQAKALLVPHGISLDARPEQFARRWAAQEMPAPIRHELAPLAEVAGLLDDPIHELDARLEKLGEVDPDVKRLMTVPGIGPVTAATWVAMLDGPARFQTGEQVVAFLGLVPREWSSSDVRLQGRITKAGPGDLRDLLIECAWHVLILPTKGAESLRAWAQNVAQRRGKKKAVVALARKLARILFVIWRDGVPYSPELVRGRALTS